MRWCRSSTRCAPTGAAGWTRSRRLPTTCRASPRPGPKNRRSPSAPPDAALRLRRPSPALVISIIALFVALSGTGYAVSKVPKRSVGSAQLRVDAVRNKNIKAGAVSRSKVRAKAITATQVATDSLLGRNILESSLTKVPDSDKLDGLDSSKFLRADRIQRFTLGDGESSAFYRQGPVTFTAGCRLNVSG